MAGKDGEKLEGEKADGEVLVPWIGQWPGNMAAPPPPRGWPMLMAMETFLACSSSAANAALFALSFFSLSALALVSTCRRSSSAAHSALDTPGGRSFFGRDFLGFGGMVVDEKEEEENGDGYTNSAGENGDMQANWREIDRIWRSSRRLRGSTRLFRAKLFRPESPSAPRETGDGVGSPDGFRPKSGGKRAIGGATGPNFTVRM